MTGNRPEPHQAARERAPLPDEERTDVADGGEPACWAHLVCPECGAMENEGHREWCSVAQGQRAEG